MPSQPLSKSQLLLRQPCAPPHSPCGSWRESWKQIISHRFLTHNPPTAPTALQLEPVCSAWPGKAQPELVHRPLPNSHLLSHVAFFLLPELTPTAGPLHQLYPWPQMLFPYIVTTASCHSGLHSNTASSEKLSVTTRHSLTLLHRAAYLLSITQQN